ncbi:hypothetical protein [Mucilaginibacter lacusdianchii]|uniref:hypothetical protein n=1 Tax=Mucilaginibacter lacusdianchii TaxID=2684211 RepID=UPI00131BCF63|nr:hypothetical protein [Mucilaginibacter sp. JXJ CY 39]
MKAKIFGSLLIAVLAITSVAQAQTRNPYVRQQRIEQGIRHGQITHTEAVALHRQQIQLERERRMALADGRLTRFERKHLQREEARLSYAVERSKHNDFRRY